MSTGSSSWDDADAPRPASAAGGSRRVLVVEDDPDLRAGIVESLDAAGYAVTACSNGREAIARLRAIGGADLVVLDLRMPVMDGWQFRAEQKQSPALASIPVLVMSGDEGAKARAIDAEQVLQKPFNELELLYAVRHILSTPSTRPSVMRATARAERMASLGTLAAGVAHEINNPLASLIGRLELVAQADGKVDAGSLADMLEAAQRIRRIVRDIQTFARVDESEGRLTDPRTALDTSLRLVSHELRPHASIVKSYGDVPLVRAGDGRLGQVFVNLLVNAAHAIGGGEPGQHEIRIVTRAEGGFAVIEIADSGSGVAPGDLGHIFDPFFTTKPVGSGTGLGLSICHGIVTGLGGRIEVESEPGRGSTFRVRLPGATPP